MAAAAPVRPLAVESVPAFTSSVVRLSPDSAARLSKEGRAAVSAEVAPGLELSLWAPESMVADPIGVSFDERGRMFVTSTRRSKRGEIDIRQHPDWMIESITFKDIEDKRAFYKRVLAPENSAKNGWQVDWNKDGSHDWRDLTVNKEAVFRLEDTNGDGVADLSQLVLEDFHDLVSDVAQGVLSYKNDLYVTIAPDLWRLRDTNGDGLFDTKESLSHGTGVHIGFGGHGHSGPIIGPDGRIYFKQSDLGVNITTREGRKLVNPNSGVILRAEPDGTEEEIFATGMRNPHEFAFDEYGNLISPDNDGDHPGETERLLYVVDGMDSGWRINWQFGKYGDPDNNSYKVWMEEGMFKPRLAEQAAYFTPPIAAWHDGPAGLAYNPGTALGEQWKGYFFNSVFTGSPARSSIRAFKVAPKGAGFRLTDDKAVLQDGVLATGVKFGPDGALYLADWIVSFEPKGRGRIWKLDVPGGATSSPIRVETRALIAADFSARSPADLVALLRHPDMRVRTKAQFALVDRGAAAALLGAARQTADQLERVHGMWGIAQLARKNIRQAAPLTPFLRDGDAEIRAQAAKLLGDLRYVAASEALLPLLRDESPRVRFFAAEALGRVRNRNAIGPIVEMLAANNDEDVYLRHAGAVALSRIGVVEPIVALTGHQSRAVRIAAVVALRRMREPAIARFLANQDEYIVTEAARAINDDGGIADALPALAAALDGNVSGEAFVRRAINANLRVGSVEAAQRVARYAVKSSVNDEMRAEAIAVLGVWARPSRLDRVDGTDLGLVQRDTAIARAALGTIVEPLLATGSSAVQIALANAVGRLRLRSAAPLVVARVGAGATPEVRIAALRALAMLADTRTAEAVRTALGDKESTVRMAALEIIPTLDLPEATTVELLSTVIGKGTFGEQQSALQSLGRIRGTIASGALARLVDQLVQGRLAPEIQLDVAEAARGTKDAALGARLDALEKSRSDAKPVVAFADARLGGNARRGQQVTQSPTAQCTRCHSFGGPGANVGPNLRGVGSRLQREQLLEALVDPSARIAPGFGPVQVTLKNGQKYFGTLKEETDGYIVVDVSPEPKKINKSDIAQRTNGPSPMPPMGSLLTHREIRDVVEYLDSLK
ncbi:MAG TPA: HEAT repeat domain-containing protein [Gemmatimonadaceae bacterium]|nr:HEAT repeat domain-containing protein [Gemmatimonadaceae bacterium]